MPIHVQIWTGASSARVTDMTNAGKRGKTCEKTIAWTHCAPDALGDQLYILCGTILRHGLQDKIVEVFEEIQRSNMSKLDANGKAIYREDGKVLKSELYFKPNIKKILED